MAFVYDIKTSKKDNKSSVCLVVCHLLFNVINLFVSTFLIAHIYTLTSDIFSYVIKVAIFQISAYLVMLVAYYLFSFVVDKTNRIWVYRLGNILNTALVVVTIFYGKNLAEIVVLAGALKGLADAAYYASYNVLRHEIISRKSVEKFTAVINVLNKIVGVVCPILLGFLIDISTYSMVAVYVLIISLILIAISFFIKAERPSESSFTIKEYFARLKADEKTYKKIKSVYLTCAFFGVTTATQSLLSINIMMLLGSSFSLGLMSGIFAIVSTIVVIMVSKYTEKGKRKILYIFCSILPVISAVIFITNPNLLTLIIYNAFIVVTETVNNMILSIYRYKNLKEAGLYQDIAEHQCVVESIYQVVRIVTYFILILISLLKNYILFQVVFVIFVSLYCVTSLLLFKYEKNEILEQENTRNN